MRPRARAMPERLAFGFSDLHPAVRVKACCPGCLSSRFFTAADLPAAVRDLHFRAIEKKLRCTDRGLDGRHPPCGGRMEIQIITPFAGHVVLRDGA
jgi:hypothetical protein